ncbi:MAG: hypothetical protein WBM47_08725 [Polyangiales bacterium]
MFPLSLSRFRLGLLVALVLSTAACRSVNREPAHAQFDLWLLDKPEGIVAPVDFERDVAQSYELCMQPLRAAENPAALARKRLPRGGS